MWWFCEDPALVVAALEDTDDIAWWKELSHLTARLLVLLVFSAIGWSLGVQSGFNLSFEVR